MQYGVAGDERWRLEIADGPNSGASAMLAPGRYRLGSGTINDIVLGDPTVASEQAEMDLSGGRARIVVFAPGVRLQRRKLDCGRDYRLKSGIVMTLGATRVRLTGPAERLQKVTVGKLAVCVATFAIVCGVGIYHVAAPDAVGVSRTEPTAAGSTSTIALAQAVEDFRVYLAKTGALPTVKVAEASGVVLATGNIFPTDRPKWLDAQVWFDGHLGDRYELIDRVATTTAAELPQLGVAAVSMAPVPNVITQDGQRYTVGAILPGGWSIARIAANTITLRNGAREVQVNL